MARKEMSGKRDSDIEQYFDQLLGSELAPTATSSFLAAEYQFGTYNTVALIDYRMWTELECSDDGIDSLGELGDCCGVPALIAYFHTATHSYHVIPANSEAVWSFNRGEMSEHDFVSVLYRLRGEQMRLSLRTSRWADSSNRFTPATLGANFDLGPVSEVHRTYGAALPCMDLDLILRSSGGCPSSFIEMKRQVRSDSYSLEVFRTHRSSKHQSQVLSRLGYKLSCPVFVLRYSWRNGVPCNFVLIGVNASARNYLGAEQVEVTSDQLIQIAEDLHVDEVCAA